MGRDVRVKDRGYDALMKRLAAGGAGVTVGIHEDVGGLEHPSGDGATIAEIASFHELGLGVPRRSFISDYVDGNETELRGKLKKIGEAVVTGAVKSVDQGLDRFGLLQVGEVQQRIRDGIEPELTDETIEAKGSSTPLIDSGVLWGSVKHKVVTE